MDLGDMLNDIAPRNRGAITDVLRAEAPRSALYAVATWDSQSDIEVSWYDTKPAAQTEYDAYVVSLREDDMSLHQVIVGNITAETWSEAGESGGIAMVTL